jgi:hypothetical protein
MASRPPGAAQRGCSAQYKGGCAISRIASRRIRFFHSLTPLRTERRILGLFHPTLIFTCVPQEIQIASYRHTFPTEVEAKAFFQGVASVSNLLVNVEALKVEAVEPIREGELWAVYVIVKEN